VWVASGHVGVFNDPLTQRPSRPKPPPQRGPCA